MPDSARCRRWLLLGGLFLGLFAAGGAAADDRWPEANWNPRPLPDDLTLPLPCNGAIVFRPIPTPVTVGELADRPAVMGEANPESDYKEYLRQTYLLGPFQGRDANAPPRYYLAKYEVTRDQFAAVTASACPALPTPAGRLPHTGIPWHQAVMFTVQLSEWLMRNAGASLPKHDDAKAFIRLPTEDEWEYAARGGAAVSEAEFGAKTFPMADDMRRYVWFQGSRSSGNRVNAIGRLEHNPLGLFDILGNVSEWGLDPYRLNKVGRPHGLAGGHVVRGGDYRTDESRIRSSLREEVPPFGPDGEATQSPSIGFRPALALVAEFNDQRPAKLRDAFRQEIDARGAAANDPRKLLERLREDSTDPSLKQGISRIEGVLNAETRARADQEGQTIRAQIEAGGFLGRHIIIANNYGRLLSLLATQQGDLSSIEAYLAGEQSKLAGLIRDKPQADALVRLADLTRQNDRSIRKIQESLTTAANVQDRVRELVSVYLGVVLSVGRASTRTRIADESRVVLQQVDARPPLRLMPEAIKVVTRHMIETSAGRPPTPDQALNDLLALAAPAAPAPAPARP